MRNSIWKLSILVGVVCTGFLCVLQAQRGISRPAYDPRNFPPTETAAAPADAEAASGIQQVGYSAPAAAEEPAAHVQTAAAESSAPSTNPFADVAKANTPKHKNPDAGNALAQADEPFSFGLDEPATKQTGGLRSKKKNSKNAFFGEEEQAPPREEPKQAEPSALPPSDPFGDLSEPAPAVEEPQAEPAPATEAAEPPAETPAAESPVTDDPFSSFPTEPETPAEEPKTEEPIPAAEPVETQPSLPETTPAEPLGFPEIPPAATEEPAASGVPADPFPAVEPSQPSPSLPADPAHAFPETNPTPSRAPSPAPVTPEPSALDPAPNASQLPSEVPAAAATNAATTTSGHREQLTIEKQAPENAVLGQPMIYSIVVKNRGATAAHQVVVEDSVPKETRLTGTIPRAEMRGERLYWKLGTIEPNEEKKIAVRVIPLAEGEIGSIATVNFVSEVAAEMKITAPKLGLEILAPDQAQLGEPVAFTFKISNTGTGEAKGVMLRDILPEGLQHAAGNDLEYEIGAIAPGESREVPLTLSTTKLGRTVNHVVILAEGGLSVEQKKPVDIVGTPLVISRTGPKTRYLGSPALYTNMVTNKSDNPIGATTIMEIVPAGMEFAEATEGGVYDPAKRLITWRVDQIAAHESKVLKVKLTPKSEGSLTSVVRVVDPSGHKAEAASETRVVGFVSLGIDIPATEPIEVGEEMHLRVAARNRGTSQATNVRMRVVVPEHLSIVDVKAPSKHQQNGNVIDFDPVPVVDGETRAEVDITVKAAKEGDARLAVEIQADQMESPLSSEEAIYILPPVAP